MPVARSFRDLQVYQIVLRESRQIFLMTKRFPSEERYSLIDQVRRSSRAVGAMIAEAWGRRRYPAAFANKIDEAMSEAMETQAWLDQALNCQYVTETEFRTRDAAWQQIGAMLNKMIQKADEFCATASADR